MKEYIAEFSQGKHGESAIPKQELIRCQDCIRNPYEIHEDTVTVVHKTPEHCWFFASQKDPQYCSMGRKKEDEQAS